MLTAAETALVIIDVQDKLFRLMPEKESLLQRMLQMIRGVRALGLPILWAEQYPEGMGPTLPEIAALLPDLKPISKRSFSCLAHPPFEQALRATGRRQFVLLGIEAHVCVYQTAVDLILQGYQAEVIADAVASRSPHNRELGLARARQGGAGISSVEMALFELLKAAEGPAFKEILAIVK